MPYKDKEKERLNAIERKRRYNERQRILHPKPPPGKHGNHARGPKHGRWNRGQIVTSHGYVLRRVSKDRPGAFGPPGSDHLYAYEHDLVIEEHIGRSLHDGEVVHHKNGNKRDNSIENLELITSSEHMSHHGKLRGRDHLGRFKGSDPAEWPIDLRVQEWPVSEWRVD